MDTKLFVRKNPGGMFTVYDKEFVPGNIFYVSSVTGTNGAGYGRNPDAPVASTDYAVGLCTAGQHDLIILLPGHVDTISAAAGIDLDVADIRVLGVGTGSSQPKWNFTTATTADVDIDAANITVENVHLVAGFADIAVAIDVNADDFTLRNCRFSEATDLNFKICVQDAAAGGSDRITIENCKAVCPDAANTHFVNFAGTGDGHVVKDNLLIGDWGTMAVGGAGAITNCMILDNKIANAATDNDSCINLANATGLIANNFTGGGAAQANGITAPTCVKVQNYYANNAEDLSGILDPIAT